MVAGLTIFCALFGPWSDPITQVVNPVAPAWCNSDLPFDQPVVRVEDQILTLAYRTKGEKPGLNTSVRLKLTRQGDSDLWIAQAKSSLWDSAFFSYTVGKTNGQYRGPSAPPRLSSAQPLKGQLIKESVEMPGLSEKRDIHVYLPKTDRPIEGVIYLADGQSCPEFAGVLEPLIESGSISPIALVGIESGKYVGQPIVNGDYSKYDMSMDNRANEYLKVADSPRYSKHLDFFCETVPQWVETKYKIKCSRLNRGIAGFSNGGAFALTAGLEKFNKFGFSVPMSVAAFDNEQLNQLIRSAKNIRFILGAGQLEPFCQNARGASQLLETAGLNPRVTILTAGHESLLWQELFIRAVVERFGTTKPSQS